MSTLRSVKVICPICGDKEDKMVREAGILHEGNVRMYKLCCYHCGKQFWHGRECIINCVSKTSAV